MYSFIICIALLLLGYFIYGKFVEKVYRPKLDLVTPAIAHNDGVDFVPLPAWKIYMIQFLNIAGTGPIFGAIMGAKFGPACYLWIVLGSIFAGAFHDYFSGMLSLRNDGISLTQLYKHYVGRKAGTALAVFLIFFMSIVGAVFVYSPALILGDIAKVAGSYSTIVWIAVIFIYYIIATVLPIDKIIGKIYPLFAFSMLFMAVALMVCLFIKWPSIPEIWDGLGNMGPSVGLKDQSIFPCLFITVACGAISGFHATQSPLMARCMTSMKQGRPIFYGSMITEGIVALIWAAVSSYFFFDGGMQEVGATGAQAPEVVTSVSKAWLGVFGGILALLGVVAAPITSGDTALRSARLMAANLFHYDQKPTKNRLLVSIPLFAITLALLLFNIGNKDGFNLIWRYFGLVNQMLAAFTLWLISLWLVHHRKKFYLLGAGPAAFMTSVTITYICVDKTGLGLPSSWTPWIACIVGFVALLLFSIWAIRYKKPEKQPQAPAAQESCPTSNQ